MKIDSSLRSELHKTIVGYQYQRDYREMAKFVKVVE